MLSRDGNCFLSFQRKTFGCSAASKHGLMAPISAPALAIASRLPMYGANTEVGKTVVTTLLCKAAQKIYRDEVTNYHKPILRVLKTRLMDGARFTPCASEASSVFFSNEEALFHAWC